MRAPKKMPVQNTARTTNLDVAVSGDLSLDDMEAVLVDAAAADGLHLSHVTTLGRKRYPGNRHWHLKQDPATTGCLDVTYWPSGPLMWISIRNSEPAWVHEAGRRLRPALEAQLSHREVS